MELANLEAKEDEHFDVNTNIKEADILTLPFPDYESYYHAIVTDHVTSVQELLSTCSPADRKRILHGTFTYFASDNDPDCCFDSQKQDEVCVQKPLCVAAAAGSLGVLQLFLENYVDVTIAENDGNNVIHTLVMTSEQHPEMEGRMLEVYDFLCKNVPRASLKWLLRMENCEEMTPLELAMVRSSYRLVEAIFNTRGAYLDRVVTSNVTSCLWYDITEYESTNAEFGIRRSYSPLLR